MGDVGWEEVKTVGRKPRARSTHDAAASPSKHAMFMFGGMITDEKGETVPLGDMHELALDGKPVWREVKATGDAPAKREGHSLTHVPGVDKLVLFGGSDDLSDKEYNDIHMFDVVKASWKKVAAKGTPPSGRLNHAAAAIGTKLYVFGGFHNGDAVNDLFVFDAASSTWSKLTAPKAPQARCNHSMVALGNDLVVFGGRGGEELLFNDVHIFDTESKKWHAVETSGAAPLVRDFHTAVALNDDTMLIFGGSKEIETKDIFVYYNDTWTFSKSAKKWSLLKPSGAAPAARWAHSAALIDNKLYVFGGTANDDDFSDTHVLHLGAATSTSKPPVVKRRPAPRPDAPKRSKAQAAEDKKAASFEPTQKPTLDYSVSNPAPAMRKRIDARSVSVPPPRDYERVKQQMISSIEDIFKSIQGEYQQIDKARAELGADRDAFQREKTENEELFRSQQTEQRELEERHRKETENWLQARKLENDAERQKIADEWAKVRKEQSDLKAMREQLEKEREQLEEDRAAFDEKSKKLEALMAQFKGIS